MQKLWQRWGGHLVLGLGMILLMLGYHLSQHWFIRAQPFMPNSSSNSEMSHEPITPLPETMALRPDKVKLGERLFSDPRLSANNTVSCATCHNLQLGGTDHQTAAVGMNQQIGRINTPTVFNSGFNFRQFWDGRAATLEEQIDGPIHDPREMGSDWPSIIQKLEQIPSYQQTFAQLYPQGITESTIKHAIATYERSLTTSSRFDRYLRGEFNALTVNEREGYQRFKQLGCVSCHQGINVGGNLYQKVGLFGDYFHDRGTPITKADNGRYNVTQDERDRHVFKVPSLRHITRTAPYFHDGTVKTLEDAVNLMGKYQLGRELSPEDIDLIIQFLIALTGE